MFLFKSAGLFIASVLFALAANVVVPVSCDASTTVHCTWVDANGSHTDTVFDRNGDGKVECIVPNGTTKVTISKVSDGRVIEYEAAVTPVR